MRARVGAVLLAGALLLAIQPFTGEGPLELAPLQVHLTQACSGLTGLSHITRLEAENEELRHRVAQLEEDKAQLLAQAQENQRLTALLALKERRFTQGIPARLASRDPDGWFSEIVLDRGRLDGVRADMVALSAEGLVGRVSQVSPAGCRIKLLMSPGSAVPVMLARSGAVGILYGDGGYTCQMKFVSHDVEVRQGEEVLTSGLGQVYPGGVQVGHVIRDYGRAEALFQSLEVEPSVDFGRLLEVLLVARSPS